jgi:flavin reductase (DIM6/NTAB) family NADH-FMN oxidoreductase RutF
MIKKDIEPIEENMTEADQPPPGELLRAAMRHWATGVSIVSSEYNGVQHGMTVNSFGSISLDPALVIVTLAKGTRTHALVKGSGRFGVTILSTAQQSLAEIFAGRVADGGDRFAGVETFHLGSSVPLILGGLAGLDCILVHTHDLPTSTLFIGQVEQVRILNDGDPLIYINRTFRKLGEPLA